MAMNFFTPSAHTDDTRVCLKHDVSSRLGCLAGNNRCVQCFPQSGRVLSWGRAASYSQSIDDSGLGNAIVKTLARAQLTRGGHRANAAASAPESRCDTRAFLVSRMRKQKSLSCFSTCCPGRRTKFFRRLKKALKRHGSIWGE